MPRVLLIEKIQKDLSGDRPARDSKNSIGS